MPREDEKYVIDLCDELLCLRAYRNHKFEFLKGDPGKNGICRLLPVDAYYPELNLVIEYNERQHSESVTLFNRPTISGVSRDEQRRLYDLRRQEVLPANGITLIVLSYYDFDYDSRKRLKRTIRDKETVRKKLAAYLR